MNFIPLGEVADFINGIAFKPEEWESKGLPIIRIQNLTGSTDITNHYSGNFDPKYLVVNGDVLISWSASLGVYFWNGGNAILNQHIFKVVPHKGVDKQYFYYAATHILDEMKSRVHGSTMQHITKEPFESILIPLPSLPKQQHIAAILQKADRLRRLRRYARQLSDTYLQSVFLEMFGDPATNPKGWTIYKLEDILAENPQNGLYLPSENYVNGAEDDGIEMVHMSDLFYGIVEIGQLKKVKVSQKDLKKYSLDSNDILIARRSLQIEGAAKPCRLPELKKPLIFESSIIRIRPNPKIAISLYLFNYLSNPQTREAHINKYITISTISGINQDGLKNLQIMIPPLDEQELFTTYVSKYEKFSLKQAESGRQAEHLFQTLLCHSFRGEL